MADAGSSLSGQEADKAKKLRAIHASLSATSECLFVVLPFVVIAIVLGHRGQLRSIFHLAEWAIISSVLAGQTLMKLVSITVGQTGIYKPPVIFGLTLLLVGCLIPALVILTIVLLSDTVSSTLAVTQCIMFGGILVCYWIACWSESYSVN